LIEILGALLMKKITCFLFIWLCATFIATAQEIAEVRVHPEGGFSVALGQPLNFYFTLHDANGDQITDINVWMNYTFVWSATGGTIDPIPNSNSATFTGQEYGPATVTVTIQELGFSDTANFSILGPLHHITITPDTANLQVGDTIELTANGYDEHNNHVGLQNVS
jgi:hypothetical protein